MGWLAKRREQRTQAPSPAPRAPAPQGDPYTEMGRADDPTRDWVLRDEGCTASLEASPNLQWTDSDRSRRQALTDESTGVADFAVKDRKRVPTGYDATKQAGASPEQWAADQYLQCFYNIASHELQLYGLPYNTLRGYLSHGACIRDQQLADFAALQAEVARQGDLAIQAISAALKTLDARHAGAQDDERVQYWRGCVVEARKVIEVSMITAKTWTIDLKPSDAIPLPAAEDLGDDAAAAA